MVQTADKLTTSCNNTFKIGDVLNHKWIILEFIDKGGMGEVYRAHQTNLNRDVAIKVISREWLDSLDDGDEEAETASHRFKREVQSMARIRHLNVLQVYDHDTIVLKQPNFDEPVEYIAMEYIPGGSLRDTMSEEGFYPDLKALNTWIKKYFIPVLTGVQALHESGIVHRDLKPENVLLDNGVPKIADFGLSRSHSLKPITQSIDVKGSPHYMSPEHFFDFKRAGKKADVYSLGKILYEAIEGKLRTGTTPFKSVNLSNTDSSYFKLLDRIIIEATNEIPTKRTSSVAALLAQLNALLCHEIVPEKSRLIQNNRANNFFSNPKWIWAGIITATLSMVLMTIWHIYSATTKPATKQPREISTHAGISSNKTETSEYNSRQHLIPQNTWVLPTNIHGIAGDIVEIESFYMDEYMVTNQQFVDFLNQNLARINLEQGLVKGDGANWYLLGEVSEGYEPIVYRDNIFHVSNPAYSLSPVLRVTGYGATAFATYFNRRLPTEVEWLYASIHGAEINTVNAMDKENTSGQYNMHGAMKNMMSNELGNTEDDHLSNDGESKDTIKPINIPPRDDFYKPNAFGIRALNNGFGEWGLRDLSSISEDKLQENRFAVMGGLENDPTKKISTHVISRFPWEGFEEVGFRTVRSAYK